MPFNFSNTGGGVLGGRFGQMLMNPMFQMGMGMLAGNEGKTGDQAFRNSLGSGMDRAMQGQQQLSWLATQQAQRRAMEQEFAQRARMEEQRRQAAAAMQTQAFMGASPDEQQHALSQHYPEMAVQAAFRQHQDTSRPLTPEEKQQAGIPLERFAQVDSRGRVSMPGSPLVQMGPGQKPTNPMSMLHPETGQRPDPNLYQSPADAQAAGFKFMSSDEQKKVTSRLRAGEVVGEFRAMVDDIFEADSDFWSRAKQHAGTTMEALAGTDPDLSAYLAARQSVLPLFARAMGEVGNLAAQEQTRFSALIPDPRYDSRDVAEAKLDALESLATGELTPRQALISVIPKFESGQRGGWQDLGGGFRVRAK